MSRLYWLRGQLDDAEALCNRTMAGYEKTLGPDHPDTLRSITNLATLYLSRGRLDDAEPLFRRAVTGKENLLGPDHPDTLASVVTLGILYVEMRRYSDAVPLLDRAARGVGRRPEMATAVPVTRSYLGLALLGDDKPADAEAHLLLGYNVIRPALTRLDPTNRNRLRWVTAGLVEVYERTNRPEKAKEWRAKLAELPPEVAPPPRTKN
jgi:tetratricopeptide (TPR) repeat protein